MKTARSFASMVLALAILGGLALATVNVLTGGWEIVPVLSGSMRPGLPLGGVAIAERVPTSSLALRDVVIFRNPYDREEQVMHRIVSLRHTASGETVIRTQGDDNTYRDPWTVKVSGATAYTVQWSLPWLGYPAVYVPRGLWLVLAGLLVLAAPYVAYRSAKPRVRLSERRALRGPATRIEVSEPALPVRGRPIIPARADASGLKPVMIPPTFQRASRRERGQGMVEYALILVLIAVVVIIILTVLGGHVADTYSNINAGIANAGR